MASGDEEKYALQDPLDEFLAKDISKYVSPGKFSDFANALKVPQRKLDRINEQTTYQDERIKLVLYYWQQKKKADYTVQKFLNDLKRWLQQEYVDKEVLTYIQTRIEHHEKTEDIAETASPSTNVVTRLTGNEVLTDGMLLDLAMKFSQELSVHILAEKGLGMDVHVVNSSLHNNRDINMAMHDVLQKWRVSQSNAQVAYTNLYRALLKVKMENITEVLKVKES